MIAGHPKKLEWTLGNICHINHYSWLEIVKEDNFFKIKILQNLIPIFAAPKNFEENKFSNIEDAQNWAQKYYDEYWLSLTEVVIVR